MILQSVWAVNSEILNLLRLKDHLQILSRTTTENFPVENSQRLRTVKSFVAVEISYHNSCYLRLVLVFRERLSLSGSVPTNVAEPKNQAEPEQAEEPLLVISTETDVVEQVVADGGSSLPLEPSTMHPSAIPPDSSLASLNPPSPDEEKQVG